MKGYGGNAFKYIGKIIIPASKKLRKLKARAIFHKKGDEI